MSVLGEQRRWSVTWEELRKLPAFFRRDLLTMWSYRTAFITDWLNLFVQVALFALIGGLVDADRLPTGASAGGYIGFVTVGIAVASFLQIGMHRLLTAIRDEQLMGTLESVLLAPISGLTFQLGSVAYDLVYVPVRTVIFLLAVGAFFEVPWAVAGFAPTLLVVLAFIPFVWGLGMVGAALVLTVRRGASALGFVAGLLTIGSTSYVPIGALPDWLSTIVARNPLTIALEAARDLLFDVAGWERAWPAIGSLLVIGAVSVLVGAWAFRLALRRERRRGTLGLY